MKLEAAEATARIPGKETDANDLFEDEFLSRDDLITVNRDIAAKRANRILADKFQKTLLMRQRCKITGLLK